MLRRVGTTSANRIWIDTDELARLLEHAAGANRAEAARTVEVALALWHGEPLDGDDYAWADAELRQLRSSHIDLLLRAADTHLEDGDAHAALHASKRGIAIDPLHEPSWRLALRAEAQLGLKDAVTARYDRLVQILDDRLGIRPEQATVSLYRRLLA